MKAKAKILVLLASAATAASLFATPVEAHGARHHRRAAVHQHRSHGDHARDRVRVDRHRHGDRHFRVPARIHRRDTRRLREYYRSSEYYRPHRHRHYVYDFPVWTRSGYVYRPHYYCDGALFSGGRIEFHGRRVSFGFNF